MHLSALFDEVGHFLRVDREAAPPTIRTYRYCFEDAMEFARKEVGGTVLPPHFVAELGRAVVDVFSWAGRRPTPGDAATARL